MQCCLIENYTTASVYNDKLNIKTESDFGSDEEQNEFEIPRFRKNPVSMDFQPSKCRTLQHIIEQNKSDVTLNKMKLCDC